MNQHELEISMTNRSNTILTTINQYGKQLLGFIRGKVATDEDAEDVLQDVWYQFSGIPEIEALESVSGWLYRVAKNKITDRFRKKTNAYLEDFSFADEDGDIDFKNILLADANTPEEELFKTMFWDELKIALDELPDKQRDVFIQNELEGISLQTIADDSGENIKTIISRKGYAIKHLRQRLGTLYKDLYRG